MDNSKKKWPTEVFLPAFLRIQKKHPKLTSRRIAKMTKGVLAAQEALEYSLSEHDRGHGYEATVEATSGRMY